MRHTAKLGMVIPVFFAAFAGNAAWDFTDTLVRRGEVRRSVNLRYDKVTQQRLKEIQAIERQNSMSKLKRDGDVILEFDGHPPRPITYNDVSGEAPIELLPPPVPPRKD